MGVSPCLYILNLYYIDYISSQDRFYVKAPDTTIEP